MSGDSHDCKDAFGLPPGSVVVERYVYTSLKGAEGVQWLLQVVQKDGTLGLLRACKTRHEALVEADRG